MGDRLFDDLARALARPMPRRHAIRIIGLTLAGAAIPGLRPHVATARRTANCAARPLEPNTCKCPWQGLYVQDCCGPFEKCECLQANNSPSPTAACEDCDDREPCGATGSFGGVEGNAKCCPPGETCVDYENGICECKGTRCGGACCRQGQVCLGSKKCCPQGQVCGDNCCPKGSKCTFQNRKRVCCPASRVVSKGSNRFCCPKGTVRVGSDCCPPGDRNCCKDDEDLECLGARSICVRGKCQKL